MISVGIQVLFYEFNCLGIYMLPDMTLLLTA
jgi:hypothetical protein